MEVIRRHAHVRKDLSLYWVKGQHSCRFLVSTVTIILLSYFSEFSKYLTIKYRYISKETLLYGTVFTAYVSYFRHPMTE